MLTRFLSIDEISRKEGHVYHTQVYDLGGKRLLWTGAHRHKDLLRIFFARAINHRARGYCSETTFSLAMIHGLGRLELPKCRHTF